MKKKKFTLQDLLKTTGTQDSKRPTAVVGVRGLGETAGEIDTKARDFAAVEKLERVKVHDEELNKFIEEGNLK